MDKRFKMTRQEFIDKMFDYGTHVVHVYGEYKIKKTVHLTPRNSMFSYFSEKTSKGDEVDMFFEINGEESSIDDCVNIINIHKRDSKLKELGI
jgi:hypothetical protein